ncbi:slipin family protein [Variovorax sp. efr-133-TYG-130]|uniref:slipin family protein n=1 Tax=Variovorax sp. efr-133-TYG-130 TaxID=3040327 RepID=UPI002552318C|nr:slipin family protein [Variovorax sp. efr-133-TYG-130]
MLGFNRITIKKNERALLLRNGDFEQLLGAGKHWVFSGFDKIQLQCFALTEPAFEHELVDYFLAQEPELVEREFVHVSLGETQAGLRLEDGVLVQILPPATRKLYWRGLREQRIDVIDVAEDVRLPAELVSKLQSVALRPRAVAGLDGVLLVQVPEFHVGVLTLQGQMQELLAPGNHGFWRFNRQVAVTCVDMRSQIAEVSGQEILTRDKVGLRLNMSAVWRFTDVRRAMAQMPKPADHVYRELQFGLRAAVGEQTLDALLENKAAIDQTVLAQVRERLEGSGIALESVGVKDIILPGEMKTILAQVVEAEKSAQANVIRRREETAATRSLLNTAKVMEGNPVALRMKELETLERVAERIDKISVIGGLDQVLNGLVTLRPNAS